jgi:hypothetical protein
LSVFRESVRANAHRATTKRMKISSSIATPLARDIPGFRPGRLQP